MRRIFIFMIFMSLAMRGGVHATPRQGGKGLIHTHSARVLDRGFLEMLTGTRFFGETTLFASEDKAFTLWNVNGYVSVNVGLSDHFELSIAPVYYQDTNSGSGNILDGAANLPDDIWAGLKVGSFRNHDGSFILGGLLDIRIPTAKAHNVLYEPYSAGRVELGLKGLVSYYSNTVFPEEGWSLHGNIGYLNHNDVGKEIREGAETASAMSSEILFDAGLLYPAGTFDFSAEISARSFLQRPPEPARTRGFVSYLTAGVYYKPYAWLTFEMGIDIRLLYDKDLAVYPEWRGILNAKFGILPTSLFKSPERSLLEEREAERREILERMMREQGETKDADDELARIRAERQRIEEELKRLRKLLEEEDKKKKKGREG